MFYDSFMNVCQDKGISPTRVLTQLKISKGSLAQWKTGGEPLNENKKKIADYFGITIRELMAGEIEKPATNNDDGFKQTENYKELLRLMGDLSEENQDKVLEIARSKRTADRGKIKHQV